MYNIVEHKRIMVSIVGMKFLHGNAMCIELSIPVLTYIAIKDERKGRRNKTMKERLRVMYEY